MGKDFFELAEEIMGQLEGTQRDIHRLYGYGNSSKYYEYLRKSIYSSFKEMVGVGDVDALQLDLNDTLQNRVKDIVNYDSIKEIGSKLSEAVNAFADTQTEHIQQLSKVDFGPGFFKEFVDSGSFKESIDIAYEIVQEEIDKVDEKDSVLELDFSSAEELEETVKEHINSPKSFQEKLAEWTEKKKKRYFIYFMILYFLWNNFCQPYFQQNIGVPATAYVVSNVKEQPKKGAKVICQLKENVEAIILENSIYYYKISFIDEDGNTKEGYVSKKNLRLLKDEETEQ